MKKGTIVGLKRLFARSKPLPKLKTKLSSQELHKVMRAYSNRMRKKVRSGTKELKQLQREIKKLQRRSDIYAAAAKARKIVTKDAKISNRDDFLYHLFYGGGKKGEKYWRKYHIDSTIGGIRLRNRLDLAVKRGAKGKRLKSIMRYETKRKFGHDRARQLENLMKKYKDKKDPITKAWVELINEAYYRGYLPRRR